MLTIWRDPHVHTDNIKSVYSVYRIIPTYSNETTKATEPSTKDLPLAWLLQ